MRRKRTILLILLALIIFIAILLLSNQFNNGVSLVGSLQSPSPSSSSQSFSPSPTSSLKNEAVTSPFATAGSTGLTDPSSPSNDSNGDGSLVVAPDFPLGAMLAIAISLTLLAFMKHRATTKKKALI